MKRKENSTSRGIAGEKLCRWKYISSITCVVCTMWFIKVECQRFLSCVSWKSVSSSSKSLSPCKQLLSRMYSQHLSATVRHEKIYISVCPAIVSWSVVELPIKWYIIRIRHGNWSSVCWTANTRWHTTPFSLVWSSSTTKQWHRSCYRTSWARSRGQCSLLPIPSHAETKHVRRVRTMPLPRISWVNGRCDVVLVVMVRWKCWGKLYWGLHYRGLVCWGLLCRKIRFLDVQGWED